MASTVYAGGSWPSAVVILQRMHVLCRLFPGSPELAVVDFCCGVFPRGKVRGVMDLYILPPHRTGAFRTFHVTFCDVYHSGVCIYVFGRVLTF